MQSIFPHPPLGIIGDLNTESLSLGWATEPGMELCWALRRLEGVAAEFREESFGRLSVCAGVPRRVRRQAETMFATYSSTVQVGQVGTESIERRSTEATDTQELAPVEEFFRRPGHIVFLDCRHCIRYRRGLRFGPHRCLRDSIRYPARRRCFCDRDCQCAGPQRSCSRLAIPSGNRDAPIDRLIRHVRGHTRPAGRARLPSRESSALDERRVRYARR